jgi:hypothetical protein
LLPLLLQSNITFVLVIILSFFLFIISAIPELLKKYDVKNSPFSIITLGVKISNFNEEKEYNNKDGNDDIHKLLSEINEEDFDDDEGVGQKEVKSEEKSF